MTLVIPNSFTAGTAAVATQVNANFSYLASNAAQATDVQTFTANGAWNKPSGAKLVQFLVVAGGSGGYGLTSSNVVVFPAGVTSPVSAIGTVVRTDYVPGVTYSPLGAANGAFGSGTTAQRGMGGAGAYGAGGAGGNGGGSVGIAAAANTGGGGGSAGGNSTAPTGRVASLGGAVIFGAFPASRFGASETITVGPGDPGGIGGGGGWDGGAGGSGIVIIATTF